MEFKFLKSDCLESEDDTKQEYYTLCIRNISVSFMGEDIAFNKVKHLQCKRKSDVQAVRITDSVVRRLPGNIGMNFKNIIALEVSECGLYSFKLDSTVFVNLQELSLPNNEIVSLDENLFQFTKSLKMINFRNNNIKYIHHGVLNDLTELIFADFRGNVNINDVYNFGGKTGVTLSVLKAKIALYCIKPETECYKVPAYIHSLWRGDFSDFTIKAGKEAFRVHRNILAANSPVFAAMFRHNMAENLTNEMKMENVTLQSVKEFLSFLYFQEVPEICSDAMDLFALSERYQCKTFSKILQWFVVLQVNAENVSEIFNTGCVHNNTIIKKAALEEIQKKFTDKLPENIMNSMEDMADILKVIETIKRQKA